MLKKILIGTSLFITSSFSYNYNNMFDLYQHFQVEFSNCKLKDNKHTLIITKNFNTKNNFKFNILNDKESVKKYLYFLEKEESKIFCHKNSLKNFFYKNPNNKFIYKFETEPNNIIFKSFINKSVCEYIYNNNNIYKKDFEIEFNKNVNDFYQQLKKYGYIRKMTNFDKLKLALKYVEKNLPIKIDNITLLEKISINKKKKTIIFHDKIINNNLKAYNYILKLTKSKYLFQDTYQPGLIKQIKNKEFMKNLIIEDNWKVIYNYNINNKLYKVIIEQKDLL